MAWNVHPPFVRDSSGFKAVEGKGCSCCGNYMWLYSANCRTNPTGRVEAQEVTQWQQQPSLHSWSAWYLPASFASAKPLLPKPCTVIWLALYQYWLVVIITLGTMTSWNIQWTCLEESVQTELKSPTLCLPAGDLNNLEEGKGSFIYAAQI